MRIAILALAFALAMVAGCGRVGFSPGATAMTDASNDATDGASGDAARVAMPFTSGFDTGGGRAFALAELSDGAIAVAAELKDATTFDGTPVVPSGPSDALVAIVEIDGSLRWVRTFGGSGSDYLESVAVGGDGEIYVSGHTAGGYDFAGVPVVTQDVDALVARYSATGDEQWMHTFGGNAAGGNTDNEDGAHHVVVAPNGDLVVSGLVNGVVDFGDGVQTPASGSTTDAFVARFTSATGTLVWARRFGDIRYNTANSVATDANGDIYAVGYYEGTPDLGSGAVPYRGIQDAFVTGLDGSGNTRWVHTFGGPDFDWPYTVAVSDQTIAVGGFYEGTVDLQNAPTAQGSNQAFVVTYDLAGNYDWTATYGGTGCNVVRDILPSGSAWLIAGAKSGAALDGSPGHGGMDGQLATLDASGAVTWSAAFGGSGDDAALGIAGVGSAGLTFAGEVDRTLDTQCLGIDSAVGGGTIERLP